MLKSYFLIAIRSILNNKGAALINIGGLAIGFASFILIMVFVFQELSYDRFHKNADNIFRVTTIDEALGVSSNNVGITQPVMIPSAMDNFPEITNGVRILTSGRMRLEMGDDYVYSENG